MRHRTLRSLCFVDTLLRAHPAKNTAGDACCLSHDPWQLIRLLLKYVVGRIAWKARPIVLARSYLLQGREGSHFVRVARRYFAQRFFMCAIRAIRSSAGICLRHDLRSPKSRRVRLAKFTPSTMPIRLRAWIVARTRAGVGQSLTDAARSCCRLGLEM